MVVVEEQRWAQRYARPLAGLDDIRSSWECVQAAEPAAVNDAGASGNAGGAG